MYLPYLMLLNMMPHGWLRSQDMRVVEFPYTEIVKKNNNEVLFRSVSQLGRIFDNLSTITYGDSD